MARGRADARASMAKESGATGKRGEGEGDEERQWATAARGGTWGGKGREEPAGGGKRRGERRTREDGGNLSVTRRASGNERTPGNVYVLHKEGPPSCPPWLSRSRSRPRPPCRATPRLQSTPRHAAPSRAAPRHVLSPASSPLCIQPIANLRCDATHVQRVPKVPRCLSTCCLPACLPARFCLPACPGLPTCSQCLCVCRLSASPTCLRCSACLRRSRFARENRSLLEYIGEYEERPRRVAGRSTSWEMALTRDIEGENGREREGGE